VRWTGGQAVVTLPQHIDVSNADQISEQLLLIINRGATELIADMTATVSCDHAGAAAVARVYKRAAANGTQVRLVITAEIVRRVLSLNGLDRIVPVYPSLEAAAARAERQDALGEPEIVQVTPVMPGTTDSSRAADQVDRAGELLGWAVDNIFAVGVLLQDAQGLPPDAARPRIAEALRRLDDVIREARDHLLAEHRQRPQPDPVRSSSLRAREHPAQSADRWALLKKRAARTGRALQSAAEDAVALLEQKADLVGQPERMDYSTEIKRWRAFADQAQQMAEQWEQPP
jgi:anti-sigma B factor antagonist